MRLATTSSCFLAFGLLCTLLARSYSIHATHPSVEHLACMWPLYAPAQR